MHQNPKKDQFVNCAVYTRVSVDERAATQAYSTLDNQRDSCLSYIESQKSEGWRVFKTYEDSGQSGGSLNRPAIKQLIHDIKKKLIQVVVVYKIDRLTRSHRDFYSLLEVLNENGVTFVSTTQHFETNSPAGRLLFVLKSAIQVLVLVGHNLQIQLYYLYLRLHQVYLFLSLPN